MSYTIRTYECDSGGEAEPHRFEVMLASGENPKFCPACGCEVDQASLPVPAKVSIGGSAIARSTDQTYRLIEDSTRTRAEALADQSGMEGEARRDFISKFAVTDMHDRQREGDVAGKTLPRSAEFLHFENERRGLGLPDMTGFGGGFARRDQ